MRLFLNPYKKFMLIIEVFFCSLEQPRKTMLASVYRNKSAFLEVNAGRSFGDRRRCLKCDTVDAADPAELSRHFVSRPRAIGTNLWSGPLLDLKSCAVTSRPYYGHIGVIEDEIW